MSTNQIKILNLIDIRRWHNIFKTGPRCIPCERDDGVCTMIDFAYNGVLKNDLRTMVSDVPTSERTSERSGAQRSGAEWSGAKRSGTERSGAERCRANK